MKGKHWRLHMQARVVTGLPWLALDLQKKMYICTC